ncbi:MAG: hypothetical protein J6V90_07885 [Treponema sp.]|nr:hypothetical protein [Treponema sp.]
MNPFQMMANPTKALEGQLRSRMEAMMRQNPQAYQRMMEMTSGKSETDLKSTAMNLAKEQGVDLRQFASGFGIRL